METKHTPGKWQYVQEGIDAYGIIELDGTSIMHIQALRNSTGASCLKANAALIAQAPDLLAERDRLAAINAELVAALDELRRQLWAHITLDVKKHYSLMLADSAASEVTFRAKAKQTAA